MMTADRMFQEISPMETRKAAGIIKPLCSFKVNLFQLLRRAKLSSPHTSSLIDLERRENKPTEKLGPRFRISDHQHKHRGQ